jgi:hypothetical protein
MVTPSLHLLGEASQPSASFVRFPEIPGVSHQGADMLDHEPEVIAGGNCE